MFPCRSTSWLAQDRSNPRQFPICVFGFVFVPLFIKLKTETKSTLMSKLKRVDWMGAFLFVGGVTTLLIGISWAGVQFDWGSVQTIVPICIGVTGVNAAILWECYCAAEPFLTVSLFSSASAIAAYIGAFCNGLIVSHHTTSGLVNLALADAVFGSSSAPCTTFRSISWP